MKAANRIPKPDALAVIQCHASRGLLDLEVARIRCASEHDLALPLQFYVDLGIVCRSTTFRDRSLGLVELRNVNGHASITPDNMTAYLLLLQHQAAEKCRRIEVTAAT
jgi:hypothetical protein